MCGSFEIIQTCVYLRQLGSFEKQIDQTRNLCDLGMRHIAICNSRNHYPE